MVRIIFGSTCWDYISACLTHVTDCRRSNLPMRKLCSKFFNCFSRLNADRCAFNRSETGLLKRIDSDVFPPFTTLVSSGNMFNIPRRALAPFGWGASSVQCLIRGLGFSTFAMNSPMLFNPLLIPVGGETPIVLSSTASLAVSPASFRTIAPRPYQPKVLTP